MGMMILGMFMQMSIGLLMQAMQYAVIGFVMGYMVHKGWKAAK
jgi:hypothetical protein